MGGVVEELCLLCLWNRQVGKVLQWDVGSGNESWCCNMVNGGGAQTPRTGGGCDGGRGFVTGR